MSRFQPSSERLSSDKRSVTHLWDTWVVGCFFLPASLEPHLEGVTCRSFMLSPSPLYRRPNQPAVNFTLSPSTCCSVEFLSNKNTLNITSSVINLSSFFTCSKWACCNDSCEADIIYSPNTLNKSTEQPHINLTLISSKLARWQTVSDHNAGLQWHRVSHPFSTHTSEQSFSKKQQRQIWCFKL